MIVGFEDAFSNAQADYISLCLELSQGNADMVYGFIYQIPGMKTFDAFFRKDGEIKTVEDIASDDLIDRFYEVGYNDVKKLCDVCTRYEHKCPNQIKMVYHVKTGHFDANYIYMNETEIEETNPDNIFDNWMDEEKTK